MTRTTYMYILRHITPVSIHIMVYQTHLESYCLNITSHSHPTISRLYITYHIYITLHIIYIYIIHIRSQHSVQPISEPQYILSCCKFLLIRVPSWDSNKRKRQNIKLFLVLEKKSCGCSGFLEKKKKHIFAPLPTFLLWWFGASVLIHEFKPPFN